MNILSLDQRMPLEIAREIASRLRARRKERGFSQEELARRSNVSLGSLKRFENKYEIALVSLIKLATALNCEGDFTALFVHKQYRSIQDVIIEQQRGRL
jgi:transcriptional regulator with XRE-family HTH domain